MDYMQELLREKNEHKLRIIWQLESTVVHVRFENEEPIKQLQVFNLEKEHDGLLPHKCTPPLDGEPLNEL